MGSFALQDHALVDDVEHLEEGHVRTDVRGVVRDELPFGLRVFLPPDVERELHL